MAAPNIRNNQIATIKIAAKQLGMDDATYREILWTVARVRSAKDLDWAGRKTVIDHLKSRGAAIGAKPSGKPNEWAFIDWAAPDRQPLLRKICVLARRAGVGKAYVEGIARNMDGRIRTLDGGEVGERPARIEKRLEMCDFTELRRIVPALEIHLKRQSGEKQR